MSKLQATPFDSSDKVLISIFNIADNYRLSVGRIRRDPRKGPEYSFGKQLCIELKGGTSARRRKCAFDIASDLNLRVDVKTKFDKNNNMPVAVSTANFLKNCLQEKQ